MPNLSLYLFYITEIKSYFCYLVVTADTYIYTHTVLQASATCSEEAMTIHTQKERHLGLKYFLKAHVTLSKRCPMIL